MEQPAHAPLPARAVLPNDACAVHNDAEHDRSRRCTFKNDMSCYVTPNTINSQHELICQYELICYVEHKNIQYELICYSEHGK